MAANHFVEYNCYAAKAQVPCEAKGARVFGMRPAGRSPAGLLDPPYLTGG